MLNYKQLHYFWQIARTGSLTRAAERLHLTPQTLSGQIRQLEGQLGTRLFLRQGRRLELTESGRLALGYADDIFRHGHELEGVLRQADSTRPLPLRVGIADVLPKSVAYRLLAPAMRMAQPVRLIGRENKLDRLLGELATHRLDLVLADSPLPESAEVRGHSHRLVECGVSLLASPELADQVGPNLPACLDDAPLLIPGEGTALRGRLLRWLAEADVRPRIVGEFDDSALMRAFGQGGSGIFPVPSLVAEEICRQDGMRLIGQAGALREQFFAITVGRPDKHAAVAAILESSDRQEIA